MDAVDDATLDGVQREEQLYEDLVRSADYRYGRLLADAWCAAFVWKKTKEFAYPITEEVFRGIERNPFNVPTWMEEEIERLREQYQFFHWHLAFPDVFRVPKADSGRRERGDRLERRLRRGAGQPAVGASELQEKEWFAAARSGDRRLPATAMPGSDMIAGAEPDRRQTLYAAFLDERVRHYEASSHFARDSGRYPLLRSWRVNTYAVFAELARTADASRPSGHHRAHRHRHRRHHQVLLPGPD